MNELPYQNVMKRLVDNSLLHLYITVAETSRIVPVHKRNEILVRHLKPMLKDNRYRRVKSELRRLLATGRSAKGDLEAQLIDVKGLAHQVEQNASGAQRLFSLLEILRYEQGLDSRVVNETERRMPGLIYLLRDHIDNGFNDAGEQVAPVSLFLESDKIDGLVEAIDLTELFSAEMQQMNEDKQQAHILLHPIPRSGDGELAGL
ncbi:DUF2913 family protein [Shewanella psychropiezotolerans]|nr:DUF2913 family protein [Shewanella psychropiezotolerans]